MVKNLIMNKQFIEDFIKPRLELIMSLSRKSCFNQQLKSIIMA